MKSIKFSFMFIAYMLFTYSVSAEMRSSITQYGVTWTFDGQYECGQFVTGDWWVVGPVTISSASPMPSTGRNGSCVNPMPGRQGYDNRQSASNSYSTADRISYPYTLQPNQSLVTGVSKPESETALQNYGVMESQAVLTAVSNAQSSGAFRPAYCGTYKKYFTTSQVQSQLLLNLTPPASKPSAANIANYIDMPRIDHINNWTMQWGCSEQNWSNGPETDNDYPCYGRGYSKIMSQAALYVMLDVTDKTDIVNSLIQIGIDNYGVLKAGGKWAADGGHHSGRKFPVVFAAVMLNDADMLQVGTEYDPFYFGEDDQTYFGTLGTPLWGQDCIASGKDPSVSYFLNGCSGSGAKDCRDPEGLVDGCPDYLDNQTSRTWPGQMLGALMLNGAKTVWNHDAYFDYIDRWMAGDVISGASAGNTFVNDMWALYRNNLPGGGTTINVTGVSVSPSSLSLDVSQTSDLTETVSPSNATNKLVIWSSNNTSVATVNSAGLVTAVSAGTATITATTVDGSFTDNCAVTVNQSSGSVNIAENKSITVSAFQNDANGYKPGENLVDGNVSDDARWSASGFPQWAEIDLGSNYDLDQISLYPYQNRAYQYIVEGKADGGSYSTIVNRSSNTTGGDVLTDNVNTTARYVKITVSGLSGSSSSWVSLSELEVYGISSTSSVPVTGVSVSPSSLSLNVGQTSDLTETVSPSNATNKSVTWSSNNTSVATVNSNGLVTAVAAGSATITATTVDGNFTDNTSVTVSTQTVPVTGVSVSPSSLSLNVGQISDLTETVSPSNATNKSVTWSSNNTSVATVNSNGLVTAVATGSATITATTVDGNFTDNCTVSVSAPQGQSLTITASTNDQEARSNGTTVWVGQSTHRVGGAGSGYDGAAIIPFELPALTVGQSVISANFNIDLYRISNSPAGNVDLYGLPYRTTSTVNATTDFWQGTYGSDANSTAIQNDFATTSTSTGTVATNSTGDNNLAAYINAQYTSGAQEGDYIFIRLNPDVSDVANYHYWEFYSANASGKPTLDIEIGSTSNANISSLLVNATEINIYPNPSVNNIITIEMTGYDMKSNTILTILDITGKQIFTEQITSVSSQLDISDLNEGIYFVVVTNSLNTHQEKLIIQ